MRKVLISLAIISLIALPAFAKGQSESAATQTMTNMIAPQDSSSDDIVLQKGLPAVPDKKVTLDMITSYSGDGEQYVQSYIKDVVKKWYPNISIQYQAGGSADLAQVINTRIAGGKPPALAMVSSSYYISDWVKAGAIRDMTQYWNKYGLQKLVPAGIQSTFRFNGKFYGIPLGSGQNNIFYWNADVLKSAGVALPPYKTWDDFFNAAAQFKQKSNKAFYAEGYTPAWFGMAKTLALGAARYGVDLYARILNGKATAQDFRDILQFHKKIVDSASNKDYVSTNAISGVMDVVAKGDGATAFGGTWGYPRFVNNKLELGKDWGMGGLPGTKTFLFVPVGFMSFQGTGLEQYSDAVAVTAILKSSQNLMNAGKGNVPARTDINPADFPHVGRYIAAQASAKNFADSVSIPRAVAGLPPIVYQEFPAAFSGYMSGSMTLDQAVKQLMDIQQKHQSEYIINWQF